MSKEGNKIRDKKTAKKSAANNGLIDKSVHNILGGNFLGRDRALSFIPLLLLLTVLAVFYISNIYIAEKKSRQIENLNRELKELRYKFITKKSELMYLSNQSQVAKKLAQSGIKESRVPPEKIIIKEEEK
jgi:Bacteriodetes cell division protein (FtsL-like)